MTSEKSKDSRASRPTPRFDDLLVQRYVDHELRPSERQSFEVRLTGEPALAAELDALETLRGLVGAARDDPAPLGIGFSDRLLASMRRAGATHPARVWREARLASLLATWSLAAACLLALLGAAWFFGGGTTKSSDLQATELRTKAKRVLEELDRRAPAREKARGSPTGRE